MHVENFLGFQEADFDFADAGFVLVEGMNGAGKSAMIDAVVWCLFGTTLRGYEKDDVVNRRAEEGCVVTIDLEDGGDVVHAYQVTRARRHKKLKNSLCLRRGGVDVTSRDANETQLAVERALGCTLKTFLTSVVFGQDRAYRFSSLTDGEQKKILDEVLGVERFAEACALARKQVSSLQVELISARRSLERAEADRDAAEVEAVDLKTKDVDFAESQRKKVDAEREKLRVAKGWIAKARKVADVDALKLAVNERLAHLASREKKVEKGIELEAAARAAHASCKEKFDAAERELLERKKSPGTCPTCGQPVARKGGVDLAAEALAKWQKLKAELKAAVVRASNHANALSEDKLRLKEMREEMAGVQRELNEAVGSEANAKAWRQRALEHEARVAELESEESPYAALAAKASTRSATYAGDVDQLTAEIGGDEKLLARAEFWVKAFGTSGLRSLLIDSSLPLLNEEAARVSRVLTGGAVSIEFSATSEQKSGKVVDRFEVKVDNKNGAGDYAGNSSGERAKVDLCVGLALQRLVASRSSASFNVVFYDEIFDHLDSTAHEQVIEVLSDLDKESVFVVSHDDDLKAWFPATLRIVKRGGYSVVES